MLLLWSLACIGTSTGEDLAIGGDTGSERLGKKRGLHIAGRGLEVGLIGNCGEQPCVAALVSSTIHLVAWHVGCWIFSDFLLSHQNHLLNPRTSKVQRPQQNFSRSSATWNVEICQLPMLPRWRFSISC